MIIADKYKYKKVGVFGLGLSGLSVLQALQAGGAFLYAWDDKKSVRNNARSAGFILSEPSSWPWKELSVLVLSPGIAHTFPSPHSVVKLAKEANCLIIGDIEILGHHIEHCHDIIAITGTNGKSTTTALLGHVFQVCGMAVSVGGNLGDAVLSLENPSVGAPYILELSSYQLELCYQVRFHTSVLLNIMPDHLDRHDGMDGYIAAKKTYILLPERWGVAVINRDGYIEKEIYNFLIVDGIHKVLEISTQKKVHTGIYFQDNCFYHVINGREKFVLSYKDIPFLNGQHNAENIAAVLAVSIVWGLDLNCIVEAIKTFKGLAHRQQSVLYYKGVHFVNDSKATNAVSASRALQAFDNIYWIVGGLSKQEGLSSCEPFYNHVRHAFLIGDSTEEFQEWFDGRLPWSSCGTLIKAINSAWEESQRDMERDGFRNATILLSPACASFDQFSSFEERGDMFCRYVFDHFSYHEKYENI